MSTQIRDPGSILSLYRRLIALRASTPALQVGSLHLEPDHGGSVVAYTRRTDASTILVAINVGREPARWTLPGDPASARWRSLVRTAPGELRFDRLAAGETIEMEADEAFILEGLGAVTG